MTTVEGIASGEQLPWLEAATAFPEVHQEAQAKTLRFLGSIAIRGRAEVLPKPEVVNGSTLLAAIQLAALGDEQAKTFVENNVATDVAERLFKAAHQTRMFMDVVDSKLHQEDRALTDIHRNTLEQAILGTEMLHRTKLELRNAFLFESLHRAGVLGRFDAVVFSTASTAMSKTEKQNNGFFVDTDTCSIQRLSIEGSKATLESAFVAGKTTPESKRHDIAAIQQLTAEHGAPVMTSNGSDMLQHVMLIPKRATQGVADVVEWFDDAAGGTFYGLDAPRQDHHAYAQECFERAGSFNNMIKDITTQLVREASAFTSPLEAIMRLDYLSERFCVKRAVHDKDIDEAVFGEQSARHIQDARFFLSRGEYERAELSVLSAQETAVSSACPLFKQLFGEGGGGAASGMAGEEGSGKKWMHCPYCNADVFDDPCAKILSCWDCKALVVNGKVVSAGNGGAKAHKAEKGVGVQVDDIFKQLGIVSFESEQKKQQKVQAVTGKAALAAAGS